MPGWTDNHQHSLLLFHTLKFWDFLMLSRAWCDSYSFMYTFVMLLNTKDLLPQIDITVSNFGNPLRPFLSCFLPKTFKLFGTQFFELWALFFFNYYRNASYALNYISMLSFLSLTCLCLCSCLFKWVFHRIIIKKNIKY